MRLDHPKLMLVVPVLWVICSAGCREQEWPEFRYDPMRTAHQPNSTALSDPAKVPSLAVRWTWSAHAPGTGGRAGFRATPVINDKIRYIGNGNGYFYALDAEMGVLLWQYPPAGQPALVSQFQCNPS